MMNDVNYTLLEIIENPKRINSIPHDKLFEYILESSEAEDRFETFMQTLEKHAHWAYLGFALMATDMIPLKDMFYEEIQNVSIVKYRHGSINEYAIFQKLLDYFSRGVFYNEDQKAFMIRYMAETLADDEYRFCIGCLEQKYKEELFERYRALYKHGKMNKNIQEFFSFCMNHKLENNTNISSCENCISVVEYKKYVKVGNMLFYNNELVQKRDADYILKYISNPSNKISLPNICEVYADSKSPFLAVTTESMKILRAIEPISDIDFIRNLYSGNTLFVMCDKTGNVISVLSYENGSLEKETINCKSIKTLTLPLIMLSSSINILYFKNEAGEELTALIPADINHKLYGSKELSFIKFQNTYYLIKD